MRWWLMPAVMSTSALMLTLLFGCNGNPDKCYPEAVDIGFEEGSPSALRQVTIYHLNYEGHRYIFMGHDRGGGPVHDPKCRCMTQSLPLEKP